jgi:2-oxoglutarate dehydrogenase E1 component
MNQQKQWQYQQPQQRQQPQQTQQTRPTPTKNDSNVQDTMNLSVLVRAFQSNGYLAADLDPLRMESEEELKKIFAEFTKISTLDYRNYGFNEADLDREFNLQTGMISGVFSEDKPIKLREIIQRLKRAYCSTIGIEYMYVVAREECNFLTEKFENDWASYNPSKEVKIDIYDKLSWAVIFEEVLKSKFTTHKRFGLEGLETVVSGLKAFVSHSSGLGIKDITLGMAHRGRLNVLANVFKKPISQIFAEFQGKHEEVEDVEGDEFFLSGDVKYHLGTEATRTYENGRKVHLDILPNPSHLECVNPVVMGKVRAKQHFSGDVDRSENMTVLIHGDAAFAGQGIVYESMQMTNLKNFTTGGVLHVIENNQIGFTTSPIDTRNTPFCTDLGKSLESPIIHVNADDPIAVDFAFRTAAEFIKKFKKDVILDVIGYRKHGHNEMDQPLFTQPLMYKKIANRDNVLKIYEKLLVDSGVESKEYFDGMKQKVKSHMEEYYQQATNNEFETSSWKTTTWENFSVRRYSEPQDTGMSIKRLTSLGEKITTIPADFTPHPVIKKIYAARNESIKTGKSIDWGTAEALAWADLTENGYTVRLTGQDVERGTFSHRHAQIHDQVNDNRYIPMFNVAADKSNFQVHNSHLSEFAVLGFELGFSYYTPDSLVMWEAQFGDFVNGAQTIIDQFISSGESKWNISTGLVLLLPHGMDGNGPEHSSCKIERFLALMDDDPRNIPDLSENKSVQIQYANMQICNPTFAANYFHVLQRQIKRQFRKPLIIPSPKKLLKFKAANSNIEEFATGLRFKKVRPEQDKSIVDKDVKRVLICSGQVYYDLIAKREQLKRKVK